MGKRKGKRNYAIRRCGKPADKARCDMPGAHCINCNWPKMKASMPVGIPTKIAGNKISQTVST